MDSIEFKEIVKNFLKSKGFEKKNNRYFLNSNDFLCEIYVQKSSYGDVFYLNYDFHLGKFKKPYTIDRGSADTHTPYVGSRFYFTEKDKYSCQYLNYAETQLIEILNKNYLLRIKPPFEVGKKYLLDNYGTIYTTFLNFEKIIKLLGGNESDIQSIKALRESEKEKLTYLMDRRCKIVIENGKKVLREYSDSNTKYD